MLHPPSLQPLIPQEHPLPNGNTLFLFPNPSLGLVKLDITVEAGSALQQYKSQAHAANQLFGEATAKLTAQQMAEFIDFHGIVVERMTDVCTGNISFYFLRRFAPQTLSVIRQMFDAPLVTPQLFEAYINLRRAQIKTNFQKTAYLARNRHYELLYGTKHPLGTYATPESIDALSLDAVTDFIHRHYRLSNAHIVVSGTIDPELLDLAGQHLAPLADPSSSKFEIRNSKFDTTTAVTLPEPCPEAYTDAVSHINVPNAVQSTIRVGRIMPLAWNSTDYTRFMVLNTVLGGYFGSRLMSNLREDKGYTYGIYSTTQIFRGSIVFYITADVAASATQDALKEINREIDLLRQEPVAQDELDRVRNFMMGDFIRNIDGVFEVSDRYRQMVATCVDERLSTNLLDTLQTVTPEQLHTLAQTAFNRLTTVTAGA